MSDEELQHPRVLWVGARPDGSGTSFRVWAANAQRVELVLFSDDGNSVIAVHTLMPDTDTILPGYFKRYVDGVLPHMRYKYRLDGGGMYPDPASCYQPIGVHGPSEIVNLAAFDWTDQNWRGIALEDLVTYEVHVGVATQEGTFDALINRLGAIRELGVTAIQLLPVADFPGKRNWGYDGVCLFAPARVYGGPQALQRLVDAAHARNLAVILDVVYNHLGPDGNYLGEFSKAYFTDRHNPWGKALNFDGTSSRSVRDFFVHNARYWAREYHIDGLRLDAIQAISDGSEPHILAEIITYVREILPPDRSFLTLAEDANNDPFLVQPTERRGFGIDAIIGDDLRHQLYVALTGYQGGYYVDYHGTIEDIAKTLHEGWFYTGEYSLWLKRKRGYPVSLEDAPISPPAIVHSIENHDQVGNRPDGKRLNHLITWEAYRAVSVLLLLSPYTPLVFMGQEWAASTPFFFFTDHYEELGQQVTKGRQDELTNIFLDFPSEQIPNPQDLGTFLRSKLNWDERTQPPHANIFKLYKELLKLRRNHPALRDRERGKFDITKVGECTLALHRYGSTDTLLAIVNLAGPLILDLCHLSGTKPPVGRVWTVLLNSEDAEYGGREGTQLTDKMVLTMSRPGALLMEAK
jgi:maltooligosyltrehalose trehalohydrolase